MFWQKEDKMGECLKYRKNFVKILRGMKAALLVVILSAAYLFMAAGVTNAFQIPTGSDDWVWRLDNTVRYTLQARVDDADSAIIANPNADDGDRNFDTGIVSNRLDLLSEMDLVYKRYWGFRVSGAFWNDERYDNDFDNDSVSTSNFLNDDGEQEIGLYKEAKRRFKGPSGEVLDAFAFGKFESGDVPIYIKAGRHSVFWGEALLSAFHGISYGQMPLDLAKGTAQPGVEAKELFRPLGNISVVSQFTRELTLSGQFFFEWERDLVPEAGTYFGSSDLSFKGRGALILGPGVFFTHGKDIEPDDTEDFGLSARWSPDSLPGDTLGLYYRNFSDKLPHAILNLGGGTYHFAFPSDIDVYGVSYSTVIGAISVGSEISYRYNMPLVSELAVINDSSFLPESGETLGARGETLHALVNLLGLLKDTPLWDAGSWNCEFDYSRWLSVDDGKEYFKGRGDYNAFDRVTRDNGVFAANFNPQWLQVYPGVDLTLPLTFGYGLWGVSSVANGGAKEEGNWGVGLAFDILTRHKINFNYVNYFGELDKDPVTGIGTGRGGTSMLRDRDFIALTYKTSF